MKITKEQLKQIIKEEAANVLKENPRHVDAWIAAGADPASHLGAEGPPTVPPNYLERDSKENLCSGGKAMIENGNEWERGFSFLKAYHVGCEWLNDYDVKSLRQEYPDPYAHIGEE